MRKSCICFLSIGPIMNVNKARESLSKMKSALNCVPSGEIESPARVSARNSNEKFSGVAGAQLDSDFR